MTDWRVEQVRTRIWSSFRTSGSTRSSGYTKDRFLIRPHPPLSVSARLGIQRMLKGAFSSTPPRLPLLQCSGDELDNIVFGLHRDKRRNMLSELEVKIHTDQTIGIISFFFFFTWFPGKTNYWSYHFSINKYFYQLSQKKKLFWNNPMFLRASRYSAG